MQGADFNATAIGRQTNTIAHALNQGAEGNYSSRGDFLKWKAAACSAASLAYFETAYGRSANISDAITQIGSDLSPSQGLLNGRGAGVSLAEAASQQGVQASTRTIDRGTLTDLLASGRPVILQGSGWGPGGHWFVGTGLKPDGSGITIADSGYGRTDLSWGELSKYWSGVGVYADRPPSAQDQASGYESGAAASPPDTWDGRAADAASKQGVDPALFAAQMRWESGGFDPDVISGKRLSSAGAQGIAQFMPATAKSLGVNPLDPTDALNGAARYMASLQKQYGDPTLALIAYNGGGAAVKAYQEGHPFAETSAYLKNIQALMSQPASPTAAAGQGAPVADRGPSLGELSSGATTPSASQSPDELLSQQTLADEEAQRQAQRDRTDPFAAPSSPTAAMGFRGETARPDMQGPPGRDPFADYGSYASEQNQQIANKVEARGGVFTNTGSDPLTDLVDQAYQKLGGAPLTDDQKHSISMAVQTVPIGEGDVRGPEQAAAKVAPEVAQAVKGVGDQIGQVAANVAGAAQTAAGATKEGYAANINLAKFAPELRALIQQGVDAAPEAVQAARRGVVSDVQNAELARNINVADVVQGWKPGTAYNNETATAIKSAYAQALQRMKTASLAQNSDEGLLGFTKAYQEVSALQMTLHGAAAEAGRTLRGLSQMADPALASRNTRLMQQVIKNLGGREATDDIMRTFRIAAANDDPLALAKLVRETQQQGLGDKIAGWINTYYAANLLSGMPTQEKNILGSVGSIGLHTIEERLAGPNDRLLSYIMKQPVTLHGLSEVPSVARGTLAGILEGTQRAVSIMGHGVDPSDLAKLNEYSRELPGGSKNPWNWIFRGMSAADAFFGSIAGQITLHEEAYRTALAEKALKGDALIERTRELISNPTPQMRLRATAMQQYLTYRQHMDRIGDALKVIQRVPVVGRLIVPFANTPYNVLKYGLERSPVAALGIGADILRGQYRGAQALERGKTQADLARRMARFEMGLGMTAMFAGLYHEGVMTGAAPVDPNQRKIWLAQGNQEYSFKVGDQWIAYSVLPAIGPTAMLTATVMDAAQQHDATWTQLGEAAFNGMIASFTDQPYMQGFAALVGAMKNHDMASAQRLIEGIPSGFVPFSGMLRRENMAQDNTVRDPQNPQERVMTGIPGIPSILGSPEIPGPSKSVRARIDTTTGLPMTRPEMGQGEAMFSPFRRTQANDSLTLSEMAAQGESFPNPGSKIAGQELTPEQQYRYQQVLGQIARANLDAVTTSDAYRVASPAQKQELLARAESDAVTKARESMARSEGIGPADQHPPKYDIRSVPPRLRAQYQGDQGLYQLEHDVADAVQVVSDYRNHRGSPRPTRDQQELASVSRYTSRAYELWARTHRDEAAKQRAVIDALPDIQPTIIAP